MQPQTLKVSFSFFLLLFLSIEAKSQVINKLDSISSVLTVKSDSQLTKNNLRFFNRSDSTLIDEDSLSSGFDDVRFEVQDSVKELSKYNPLVLDSIQLVNEVSSEPLNLVNQKLDNHHQIDTKILNNISIIQDSVELAHRLDSANVTDKLLKYGGDEKSNLLDQLNLKELDNAKDIKTQLDSSNTKMFEAKVEEFVKQKVESIEAIEQGSQFQSDFPFQQPEAFNWDKGKVASAAKVGELLNIKNDKITEATSKVNKLKKKYSSIQLGDSSQEFTKRNIPDKRWQFNLNLESSIKPHLTIKAAPGLVFNITSKSNLGLATSMDYQYHYGDSSYQQFSKQVSIRLFSQYKLYKNLFIQGEYEQPYANRGIEGEEQLLNFKKQSTKIWIGGGIEYHLYKKLKGQTQILYNLSSPKTLEEVSNRWTVRVNLIY